MTQYTDMETGEILTEQELKLKLEIQSAKAKARQLEGFRKVRTKEKFSELVGEKLGEFMFLQYGCLIENFTTKEGKFDSALAFRFLYLATFSDYEGNLKWGSKFRGKDREYMLESDLNEVMGFTRNHVTKFKQKLIKINAIRIDENKRIILNKKHCFKGKIVGKSNEFIRTFEKGIRDLYINSESKEHKKLGNFINLIPYLNIQHNVLCFNPTVENHLEIEPLKIQDICSICSYSVSNAKRLESDLLKITVSGQPLLMKHIKFNGTIFTVNPKIFYRGNQLMSLQALIMLFDIKNN